MPLCTVMMRHAVQCNERCGEALAGLVGDAGEGAVTGGLDHDAGSIASTRVWVSSSARTTTLHGRSRPMDGSIVRAWCASGGLHAPRMR